MYVFLRLKTILRANDLEFVMGLCAAAMTGFGVTLLWPGSTFNGSAFVIFNRLVNEELAGAVIAATGIVAGWTLLRGNGGMSLMCMVMCVVFTFLATMFVLSGLNSTGNTYYWYAAGSLWSFWRLVSRKV